MKASTIIENHYFNLAKIELEASIQFSANGFFQQAVEAHNSYLQYSKMWNELYYINNVKN